MSIFEYDKEEEERKLRKAEYEVLNLALRKANDLHKKRVRLPLADLDCLLNKLQWHCK